MQADETFLPFIYSKLAGANTELVSMLPRWFPFASLVRSHENRLQGSESVVPFAFLSAVHTELITEALNMCLSQQKAFGHEY